MTTPETLIAQLDGAALQLELDARDDTIAELTARIDAALAVHTRLAHLGCPWDEINAAPNLVIGRPAGLDLAVALDLDPAAVA